jgi:hypothetical protein
MPHACILHAVRHPADVALSSYEQSFVPTSIPWSFNITSEPTRGRDRDVQCMPVPPTLRVRPALPARPPPFFLCAARPCRAPPLCLPAATRRN